MRRQLDTVPWARAERWHAARVWSPPCRGAPVSPAQYAHGTQEPRGAAPARVCRAPAPRPHGSRCARPELARGGRAERAPAHPQHVRPGAAPGAPPPAQTGGAPAARCTRLGQPAGQCAGAAGGHGSVQGEHAFGVLCPIGVLCTRRYIRAAHCVARRPRPSVHARMRARRPAYSHACMREHSWCPARRARGHPRAVQGCVRCVWPQPAVPSCPC